MQKNIILCLTWILILVFVAKDIMTLKQYAQNVRPTILVYCFMGMYGSFCFKEIPYSALRINKYLL